MRSTLLGAFTILHRWPQHNVCVIIGHSLNFIIFRKIVMDTETVETKADLYFTKAQGVGVIVNVHKIKVDHMLLSYTLTCMAKILWSFFRCH